MKARSQILSWVALLLCGAVMGASLWRDTVACLSPEGHLSVREAQGHCCDHEEAAENPSEADREVHASTGCRPGCLCLPLARGNRDQGPATTGRLSIPPAQMREGDWSIDGPIDPVERAEKVAGLALAQTEARPGPTTALRALRTIVLRT